MTPPLQHEENEEDEGRNSSLAFDCAIAPTAATSSSNTGTDFRIATMGCSSSSSSSSSCSLWGYHNSHEGDEGEEGCWVSRDDDDDDGTKKSERPSKGSPDSSPLQAHQQQEQDDQEQGAVSSTFPRNSRNTTADNRNTTASIWRRLGPYLVLVLCLLAAGFTFIASWSCNTFYGAEMPWFVGGGYGIWSLQDSQYNCQLWSVLFFAYQLDAPLRAARFLSMTAMLASLAAIAILTQLIPWGRIGSWIVATALMYWLGDSISYWWRFNVWSTFFILTYLLMVLVVKCVLLERFAPQTLWRVAVQRLFVVACLGSVGIFCILASRVCMCDELTEEELEYHGGDSSDQGNHDHDHGEDDDDHAHHNGDDAFSEYYGVLNSETYARPEHCSGMCVLGPTSLTAITTPFLWLAAWFVAYYGVQPSHFSGRTGNQVAADTAAATSSDAAGAGAAEESSNVAVDKYESNDGEEQPPKRSFLLLDEEEEHGTDAAARSNGVGDKGNRNNKQQPPARPRLGTAATFAVSEDDDEEDEYERQKNDILSLEEEEEEDALQTTRHSSASSGRTTSSELVTIKEQTAKLKLEESHEEKEEDNGSSAAALDDDDDMTITTQNTEDVRPRKRTPTRWRKIEQILLGIVTFLYVLVVLVMVGTYFENKNAAKAPDTSYNFITDVVCAFYPLDPTNRPFETFDNATQAQEAGYEVAHCGECGECSNPADIEKYVETRKTVAESAKKCSMEAIFGKDEELMDCLEREIGFTRSCTGCWANNMRTTAKHCMWTCLSSMLIGIASSNTVEDAHDYDWLNQCVFCDEKQSGPDFVACSGVARRRLGIQSEFERNPLEQCPHVQIDYVEQQSNVSQIFLP